MKLVLTSILIIAAALPCYAKIAVNFPGTLSVSGVLGAPGYEQANWLNTINWPDSWATTYNLQDENAAATGAMLSFWASAFGDQQTFVTTSFPMAARMLETAIGTWTAADPATFTVTDIPYEQYDVVIYFGSRDTFSYVQKVTVNGTTLRYGRVPVLTGFNEMGYRLIPEASTLDLADQTPYGNYMVFENVSTSTLVVSAVPGWYSGVDPRAYISGFQIIEASSDCDAATMPMGDLNGDCLVDAVDLTILANAWLLTGN